METTHGFGRRIIPSTGRALTLVPEALEGVEVDLTGRGDLKDKVRAILSARGRAFSSRAESSSSGLVGAGLFSCSP